MIAQHRNATPGSQVATCQHPTCYLPAYLGNSGMCVLHDPDPGKDAASFEQALEEKIKGEEEDDSVNQVDLSGVVFPREANFRRRVFTKAISFAGAKFTKGANFGGAEFGRGANFINAEFKREGNFTNAKFGVLADFIDAEFNGEANFQRAEFGGRASFQHATFCRSLYFNYVTVRSSLTFQGIGFPPKDSQAMARLLDLTLEYPQEVRFEAVDLSRTSFLRTNVSRIRFVGCTWPEKKEPTLWPLRILRPRLLTQGRSYIYDENEQIWSEEGRHLVHELYRQLRFNLEADKQEVEAGDFYIGQMEMRRQDTAFPRPYRLLLAAYRVLAMYGQSYGRPFFWYAFILAPLFAFAYSVLRNINYSEGLFSALTAGALFREVPEGIESWEKLLVYFNMLEVILLLGLTVLALRRHFTR